MNRRKKILKKINDKSKRAHARKYPKNKPAYITKAEQAAIEASKPNK